MMTYMIRLNGSPFFQITVPDYMDPLQAAREVLLGGKPASSDVIVTWQPAAVS